MTKRVLADVSDAEHMAYGLAVTQAGYANMGEAIRSSLDAMLRELPGSVRTLVLALAAEQDGGEELMRRLG